MCSWEEDICFSRTELCCCLNLSSKFPLVRPTFSFGTFIFNLILHCLMNPIANRFSNSARSIFISFRGAKHCWMQFSFQIWLVIAPLLTYCPFFLTLHTTFYATLVTLPSMVDFTTSTRLHQLVLNHFYEIVLEYVWFLRHVILFLAMKSIYQNQHKFFIKKLRDCCAN